MPWTVLSDPSRAALCRGGCVALLRRRCPRPVAGSRCLSRQGHWFTECSGGEWSPKFDETLGWMTDKLIIGGANNWSRGICCGTWRSILAHGPHIGGCGDCRGVVTIDPATGAIARNVEYYVLGHASRGLSRRLAGRDGNATCRRSKLRPSSTRTEAASRSFTASLGDGPDRTRA